MSRKARTFIIFAGQHIGRLPEILIFAPMNETLLPICFAPLQGYTEAVYRQAHARVFGGIDTYYAPFVRIEHGEIRRKDVRDVNPENNRGVHLIPQLMASGPERLERIMPLFIENGFTDVNINLGCPFPLLAKRHNGAGMLPHPAEVEALLRAATDHYPDVRFSVKLRLGWDNAEECLALLSLFNELPLSHLILHPRLGIQQYKGEVDEKAFEAFYNDCRKPLFYNGDVRTTDDIHRIGNRFPRLAGIVIGRGLLANPALASEYREGKAISPDEMAKKVGRLHAEVFAAYQAQLQGGEMQLLMKMKSFWEYLLPDGNRKAKKTIHKTTKMANYQAAVSNLLGSYE